MPPLSFIWIPSVSQNGPSVLFCSPVYDRSNNFLGTIWRDVINEGACKGRVIHQRISIQRLCNYLSGGHLA
jgi:hypothetical protein